MPPILIKSQVIIYYITGLLCVCVSSCNNDPDPVEAPGTDSPILRINNISYKNPDSALAEANKLLAITKKEERQAKVLHLMASIYEIKGNYDSSIAVAEKALKLAKSNTILRGQIHNQIGVSYDFKSDYKKALTHYQSAQEYFISAKDTSGYIKVKNNIGLIYQNSGDLKRAKEYFEECLRLSREKKLPDETIMALSNLASVENEMQRFSTALTYFREVLDADIASGNETYISYSYHNLGEAHKNLRQFDSATAYFTKSIALKEKLSLQAALVNSYKGYADLLIETGRLDEAGNYLNKAFKLARESGTMDYLKDCYYLQARLAEKKGDYKTAYAASDSFNLLKDSISNARFRTELVAKEKDQEYLFQEKLRQQNISDLETEKETVILFMVFFALVSGGLFFLLKRQQRLNKQLELQKKQIESGLAERTQLLSFIAHEIRNPLGGIMGLTDLMLNEQPTPQQRELLVYQKKASIHLLALMNDVLDYQKLGSGKVELNSIPFSLRDVLFQVYGLYQVVIREKKLNYELNYDAAIPARLMGDPIRLTQVFSNLLNNAIKFTDKGTVSISAQLLNSSPGEATIFCKVSDSGIGIPKEDQELIFELYVQSSKNKSAQLGTGLGLSIVKNLLSLMNSKIELESTPGTGTVFSFTIPFKLPQ